MNEKENKSAYNYYIFDKEYPLHNCLLGVICGSTNSGKSYFTYKYILPAYIKDGAIKTILICSRTGKYDQTTSSLLDDPIYKDCCIDFVNLEDTYERCQLIRSNAIINEYIDKFMNVKNEEEISSLLKKLKNLIGSSSKMNVIHDELSKFYSYVSGFISIDVESVREYARLLWLSGTKITYNPTIIIFDDYASSSEFLNQKSNLHELVYIRRHLHLSILVLTQSIVAVSVSIRRNASLFVLFSTLSEMDLKLIKGRLPYGLISYEELLQKFIEISESDKRDDKVISLFVFYPFNKLIKGLPDCLKKLAK